MAETTIPVPSLIRFSVFELDLQAWELRKNGAKLRLEGQPLQVLGLLVERPGQLVTREEVRQKLWPNDTFVDFEHSINTAVKKLRQALDDSAETPRFIETLPRRGYRFIYPIGNGSEEPASPAAKVRVRPYASVALAVVLLVAAGIVAAEFGRIRPPKVEPIHSIAVLPLENLTGDAEQQYLVDGMHDELITQMAQIGSLKVISRTSVLPFKQPSQKSAREIAEKLGVEGLMEGTVQRSRGRVHLSLQLIHAASDRHVWAQSYDRDIKDVLALQAEAARDIARSLNIELTAGEKVRLSGGQKVDPEAYQAYLKGKYFAGRMSQASRAKAAEQFRAALDIDPSYARAWAALGEIYMGGSDLDPEDKRRQAEAALLRAVELDPTLREPHQALGRIKLQEWDFAGAAREFDRAHELDPRHPGFVAYQVAKGDFEGALVAHRQVADADPLNYATQVHVGWAAFFAAHYDEAITALKRAARLDPKAHTAHFELGWNYAKKGMYKEAVAECETALELLQQERPKAKVATSCGWVYAVAGDRREALRIAQVLEQQGEDGDEGLIQRAHIYDALGDRRRALEILARAYETRNPILPRQWASPMLSDGIKSDPRFQELIRRTGNPWAKFPAGGQALAKAGREREKQVQP